MQFNYYTLKRLSSDLSSRLVNSQWLESFSQQKDELIISLITEDNSPFYIRCTLRSDFSTISFPQEYHKSRKNVVTIFPELSHSKVERVEQYENERAFSFHFNSGFVLLFKLFGNRSNIILFDKAGNKSLFKKKLVADNNIQLEILHRPIIKDLASYRAEPNVDSFFPTFDKTIKSYLNESGFNSLSIDAQWELLMGLEEQLNSNPFLLLNTEPKPTFSLLPLNNSSKNLGAVTISALNDFYSFFTREYTLKIEKAAQKRLLEKRIKQCENYITQVRSKLSSLENEISPSQIADILMANLHALTIGQTKVSLLNFYTGAQIEIKLKKDLSPQKNAEQYYRKSKNRKIELEMLRKNIEEKRKEISNLQSEILAIDQVETIKALRKLSKQNSSKSDLKPPDSKPFKEFIVDGFKVWVGKNAKSNDELTLKYRYKEDLWFHAKDVSGSHVLLKHVAGQGFPTNVIEKVAALAAYYSKRKKDNHVPVIYTPAKFIRKRKGSLPGQVIVEREKVILVNPSSY